MAELLIKNHNKVPILISLPDWTESQSDLLTFISKHPVAVEAGILTSDQRLSEAFYLTLQQRSGKIFEMTDMNAFLAAAHQVKEVKEYFDDITDLIVRDDKAIYAIIDLLEANPPQKNSLLRALGITTRDGQFFAPRIFQEALRERCSLDKLAQRFGAIGNWIRATSLYEYQLARWEGTPNEKEKLLKEAINASYAGKDTTKFTSFAHQLSQLISGDNRMVWLRDTFVPQAIQLTTQLSEKEPHILFNIVVSVADVIARTGRIRLYLADSSKERLICRNALGANATEFLKEPVTVKTRDWKIAEAYCNKSFIAIRDISKDNSCKQWIAAKSQLLSAWLFPIVCNNHTDENTGQHKLAIGVFCVDNPYHCPDVPGDDEQGLVKLFLEQIGPSLRTASSEAERKDLQVRIERLVSLHQHLLTDHPAKEILEDLFSVANELYPNFSMIAVRLIQGYKNNRLGIEEYWPRTLEPVFSRPDMAIIDESESFARPSDRRGFRFVYNVMNREDNDSKGVIALTKFISAIKEEHIDISLGSLLSFRLETPQSYIGMCNFYTTTPREFLYDEIELLFTIVKQAAVALYYAKQIKALDRHRKGLQILSDCIRLINEAAISTHDLIRYITDQLATLFEVQSASWASADYNRHKLRISYTWPEEKIIPGQEKEKEFEWNQGVIGRAINSQVPTVLSIRDTDWSKVYEERVPGIKTCAAIPIKDQQAGIIGILALETSTVDTFTYDDIALIDTIVNQVPVAINNWKLVDELRQANKALEDNRWLEGMGESVALAVHRVSNTVSSIPSLATEIKQVVSQNANKISKTDYKNIIVNLTKVEDRGKSMLQIANRLSKSGAKVGSLSRSKIGDAIRTWIKRQSDNTVKWNVYGDSDIELYTDWEKLNEILFCLLENAMKASAQGVAQDPKRVSCVTVSIKADNESTIIIDVKDSGLGVPKAIAQELGRTIIHSNWNGHGIGLFSSTRMAKVLGGKLHLFSNSQEGATFRLELPIVYKPH